MYLDHMIPISTLHGNGLKWQLIRRLSACQPEYKQKECPLNTCHVTHEKQTAGGEKRYERTCLQTRSIINLMWLCSCQAQSVLKQYKPK